MPSYDVIVVGLGVIGASALHELAKRGAKVLGIEQFGIGHDRGSSHGETRIIRKAYFEHQDYVPLLHRTYELWSELESVTNRKLFHRTGVLICGEPDTEVMRGIRRSATQHNIAVHVIGADEVRGRFPQFRPSDTMDGILEPDAGFLEAEACVLSQFEQAVARGASTLFGQEVRKWTHDGSGIRVSTDQEEFTADNLVVTGGPWVGALCASVAPLIEVRRKPVFWFPTSSERFRVDTGCPVYAFVTGDTFFYGFPELKSGEVKVAEHTGGEVVENPDSIDREMLSSDLARITQLAGRYLDGVTSEVRRFSVCMYAMSPDGHGLIGAHPLAENVFLAAGFSGHGFKFGPVVGETLAEQILTGSGPQGMGFLDPARFAHGLKQDADDADSERESPK